jgi:hypothetical protein
MDDLVELPPRAPSQVTRELLVDLDLGELGHEPSRSPYRPATRRPRGPGLGSGRSRAIAALALVGLLSGVLGWQVGAHRAAADNAPATAHPAVVSWLEDNGPNLRSTDADPSEDLAIHVTNLDAEPIRLQSVVAHTPRNPVDLHLTVLPQAPVLPGRTSEVVLVAHAACRSTYPSASMSLRLSVTGAGGGERTADVPVVDGGGVGVSFRDVLNRLCLHPTPDAASGGVDGVYVQSTFTAEQATVIMENRTAEPRSITFAAERSAVFTLLPSPRGPIVLPPGQSMSATVRARVSSCHELYTLSEWADSARLEVRRLGRPLPATDDGSALTSYPLKGLLLATLGATVQRSCGTAIG